MKDYYKILGINKDATQEDIKKAYRKRAKETHPDITQGSCVDFVLVNEAYSVLSSNNLRQRYDKEAFDLNEFEFIFQGKIFEESKFGFSFDPKVDQIIKDIFATHIAYFLKYVHCKDKDCYIEFKSEYFKKNVIPDLESFLHQPALDGIEILISDRNVKPLFNIIEKEYNESILDRNNKFLEIAKNNSEGTKNL